MEIARKTKTQLHAWDERQTIVDVDGSSLSADEAALYGQLLWDDGLIAEAFRYSENNKDTIPASQSLFDFFKEKAQSMFTDLETEEAARRRRTLLNVASMWGAYVGSPIETQSLKFYWLEECIEGGNPFVAETYHKILAEVAWRALENANILYRHEVTKVTGRDEKQGDLSRPSITTRDGTTKEHDEVVMTAPLGWLKRNKSAFSPGLTPRLAQAIDNIGYGCLDKV